MFFKSTKWILLLLLAANTIACGQSGPLYLPRQEESSDADKMMNAHAQFYCEHINAG